ncbi:MAG: threonine ammonia-lyase [Acidobacteria bacterium]|nr:threonine ammonia-lyase [Acidobacteriota bacterium]
MISLSDITRAAASLHGVLEPTPMLRSAGMSESLGRAVYLKAENLQRTGSFKIRGAYYKILNLTEDERGRGVIASSAGNHAQGVALAARLQGIPATIVMPEDASLFKVMRTQAYGAEVVLHGRLYDDAYQHALALQEERGLAFVHAFEDPLIMAGQGTAALEILEQLPDVDTIIVPVGGGGLISGIAAAAKSLKPDASVIGVQARGAAPGVVSFKERKLVTLPGAETIADGIRVRTIGSQTFDHILRFVDDMVTVTDDEIAHAMVFLLEDAKLVAEGAGAVGVAALLSGRIESPGKICCAVISGGNLDLNFMAQVIEHGLTAASRHVHIGTYIPDRPGELGKILGLLSGMRVNILDVEHHRAGWDVPLGWVEVELLVETRNDEHSREILESLNQSGYRLRANPEAE